MDQLSVTQRRQQIAEMLRNKGVICKDYLSTATCPRTPNCPYMHIAKGETRPVPWSVCTFFNKGVCLRDRCNFFHGTQQQLDDLRASGADVYMPQEYMLIAEPPREFLNPDGSIAVDRVVLTQSPIAPQPSVTPQPAIAPQTSIASTTPLPSPPNAQPQDLQSQQQKQQTLPIFQPLQPLVMMPSGPFVSLPQLQPLQYHYIQAPGQQIAGFDPQQVFPAGAQPMAPYGVTFSPFSNPGSSASFPSQLTPLQQAQPSQEQLFSAQAAGQPIFFQIPQN